MIQILHITAHMGGGVGKALSGLTIQAKKQKSQFRHKILVLEKPEKEQFIEDCLKNDVEIILASDKDKMEDAIQNADIIQISWWHHPKIAQLLSEFPQIETRMIIWSHISGCTYPAIPFEFVKYPHKFLFTTPYSLDNHLWTEEQRLFAINQTDIIYGAGDFSMVSKVKHIEHEGFNIGYIGTLNYSKINPEFVKFCSSIDIPEAKFIMVGDLDNQTNIEREIEVFGMKDKFRFEGYVKDISKIIEVLDVFGYPLNPYHFGTTENVLLEAMSAGIPVVVLNQGPEKYIVKHMETGLLANTAEEYGEFMDYLYKNSDERMRIGENAKTFVSETFTLEKTIEKMNKIYIDVMKMNKKVFEFKSIFGEQPYEWFLTCLGEEKEFFKESIECKFSSDVDRNKQIEDKICNCSHILREKSKSSINHFASYFPDDEQISYWKALIDEN